MAFVIPLGALAPETDESPAARRLRVAGRLFGAVFGILLAVNVTLLAVAVWAVLFYGGDHLQIGSTSAWVGAGEAPAGFRPFAALSLNHRLAYGLVALVRAAPAVMIFWNLRALFRLYERGVVFARENTERIQWVGVLLAADALAPFACHLFLSLTGLEIDRGWLHATSFQELLLGGMVFVIAQVMQLGREIEADRAQFV